MNERRAQNLLFSYVRHVSLALPCYTPHHWYECDLFTISKRGYWSEFEIKLTTADLRADAKKGLKHERLTARDPKGPSHFWFVMPKGMVPEAEVPAFAGIKILVPIWDGAAFRIQSLRPAPRLHGKKCNDQTVRHAMSVCYWRYWHERIKNDRIRDDTLRTATLSKGVT